MVSVPVCNANCSKPWGHLYDRLSGKCYQIWCQTDDKWEKISCVLSSVLTPNLGPVCQHFLTPFPTVSLRMSVTGIEAVVKTTLCLTANQKLQSLQLTTERDGKGKMWTDRSSGNTLSSIKPNVIHRPQQKVKRHQPMNYIRFYWKKESTPDPVTTRQTHRLTRTDNRPSFSYASVRVNRLVFDVLGDGLSFNSSHTVVT